jgi:cob(I)alamin adenosyltransferase
MGEGFTQKANNEEKEKHRAAAQATLAEAKIAIQSGAWDMVILDEINYAVKFELIGLDEVIAMLDCKPASLHLVLTGRDARQEIMDRADLVTEMKEIKHPYQSGIKAQAGIEF